jgi:hypothetical protein
MSLCNIYIQANASVFCVDTRSNTKVLILPSITTDLFTGVEGLLHTGVEILFKDVYGNAANLPFTLSTSGANKIERTETSLRVDKNYATITLNSDGSNSWLVTDFYDGTGFTPTITFRPDLIPNLMLWFDAQDSTTLTFGSGSNIQQWNDKSHNVFAYINNYNGAQWVANSIGKHPSVFVANSNYPGNTGFYGNLNSSYYGTKVTSFCIANQVGEAEGNGAYNSRILSYASDLYTQDLNRESLRPINQGNGWAGPSNYGIFWEEGGASMEAGIALSNVFIMRTMINGDPYNTNVLTAASNGNLNPQVRDTGIVYGLQLGAFGLGTTSYQGYSQDSGFYGYIGEVISYSNALELSDAQKVEGYLAWKWGMTSLLPSAHPYKNVPPTP